MDFYGVKLEKLIRFLMAGGIIAIFRLLAATVATEWLDADPVLVYRIVLVICFFIYFYLNLRVIFKVHDRLLIRLLKYSFFSACFLSLDGWLVGVLYRDLEIPYFLSYCFSIGTLVLVKFLLYDRFVFQPTKPAVSES